MTPRLIEVEYVLDRGVEKVHEILYVESGRGFLTRTLRSRDAPEGSICQAVWAAFTGNVIPHGEVGGRGGSVLWALRAGMS